MISNHFQIIYGTLTLDKKQIRTMNPVSVRQYGTIKPGQICSKNLKELMILNYTPNRKKCFNAKLGVTTMC